MSRRTFSAAIFPLLTILKHNIVFPGTTNVKGTTENLLLTTNNLPSITLPRGDLKYIGDRSAFDVYVEFLSDSGKKGFIGIEVKYHENLKNKPADIKPRYFEVASEMKCFRDDCIDRLKTSPLEQVWRDHLLAGSLLNSDDGFNTELFK